MAATDSSPALGFELHRFEWTGDDRLEVAGRWFGVRGRRFVRPTLNVRVGGRRRRMIAVLDHKPWPAEEDALWIAAFAWRGPHEGVTAARLEVSPDVVIELPLPGTEAAGTVIEPRAAAQAPRKEASEKALLEAALAEARRERDAALAGAKADQPAAAREEIARLREELSIARAARPAPEAEALQAEIARLREAPARERAEVARLRSELEAAQAEAAHWRREHESLAPASGAELGAAKAEASELRAKLRGAPSSAGLQTATADLEAARAEVTRLKTQLRAAPAASDLEAARAEAEGVRGELAALRAVPEADALRAQLAAAQAALADQESASADAGDPQRLRRERDEARRERDESRAEVVALEKQRNEAREPLSRLHEAAGDAGRLRRELDSANEDLRDTRAKLDSARAELALHAGEPLPPVRSRDELLAARGIRPRRDWGAATMALTIGFVILAMAALGLFVLSQL